MIFLNIWSIIGCGRSNTIVYYDVWIKKDKKCDLLERIDRLELERVVEAVEANNKTTNKNW